MGYILYRALGSNFPLKQACQRYWSQISSSPQNTSTDVTQISWLDENQDFPPTNLLIKSPECRNKKSQEKNHGKKNCHRKKSLGKKSYRITMGIFIFHLVLYHLKNNLLFQQLTLSTQIMKWVKGEARSTRNNDPTSDEMSSQPCNMPQKWPFS